jgi:hypothetical protein
MRRLIAAVALTVTLWPHIAVMRCAGPSSAPLSVSSPMQHEHQHGGGACPAIMICAAAMIESASTSALRAAFGAEVSPVALRPLPPAVAVLTDEPPPPRRGA